MAEPQNIGGVTGAGVISLKINGEMPPHSIGLVVDFHIVENCFAVPALLITLCDRNNMLRDDWALVDGTRLDIMVGLNKDEMDEFSFRVFSVKELDADDGTRILKVTALFNFPTFLHDTRSWSYRGNSVGALQYVADETGLVFDADVTTNDVMKWVGAAQSARQFCNLIEQHSYLTDKSFIRTAFTADGRMVVRDLNAQILRKTNNILTFNQDPQTGEYLVHEFRPKSAAGVMNSLTNYGEKTVYNDSEGKTVMLTTMEHESEDPMNVSSEIRTQIHGARRTYVRNTTDINLHKDWVKAEYLWKRHSTSYTETARALILHTIPPNIGLYDTVLMRSRVLSSEGSSEDPKTSGNWIVIGRTITFAQSRLSTVLLLARNFTGVQGTSEVGSGENQAETVFDTVANLLRPYQINLNISQMLGELNPIEALAAMQDGALEALTDKFKEMSDQYGFTELIDKYGEGRDYLMDLMQEFNIGRFLTGLCQGLNVLEKLSLNLSIELGDTILQDIANRLDELESLQGSFTRDIQALIDNGDIPDSYLDGVQINQSCVSNKLKDLEQNINDALPDKCMDAFSIGRLTSPSFRVAQMIRQLEENLRNMLCAMGDGTVDGSNTTGTPDGTKLSDYRPQGEWGLVR